MRFLTHRQHVYLEELKRRRSEILRQVPVGDPSSCRSVNLSDPMNPKERKMRQRIRKNAMRALYDLALIGIVGLLPDKKLKQKGARTLSGMLSDIDTFMIIEMVADKK